MVNRCENERLPAGDETKASSSPQRHQVDELRELLFGFEKQQIEMLQKRLEDPALRTRDVSSILAEALRMRWHQDDQIANAIQPAMEETIHRSVRRNPRALADAIFPVMGPALRKAVSAAIMGLIQSLNQLLEHSVSLRGVKWRIEALRTGKSFAEVILLHTLLFRVEQVFLIHRETGLLLLHVSTAGDGIKDPDLVSGMLTAIQDFVQDSFASDSEALIDTLRVGNQRSVWLEQGPKAIMAVVIQGTPPMELRVDIRDSLDMVHLKCTDVLENFEGDAGQFASISGELKGLLRERVREEKRGVSPLLWLLLLILVSAVSVGAAFMIRQQHIWSDCLSLLRAEPGYIVLNAGELDGKYHVKGFRDPLARAFGDVLVQAGMPPDEVVGNWGAYHSLSPAFIISRANAVLRPPEGVTLRFSSGVLFASGVAGHQWVVTARAAAPAISGVIRFDEKDLVDLDINRLHQIRSQLESISIFFKKGTTTLEAGQQDKVEDLIEIVSALELLGREKHIFVQTIISGHTDASGSDTFNFDLSWSRAQKVMNLLISAGIDPLGLLVVGMGTSRSFKGEEGQKDQQANRRVTFSVNRREAVLDD